MSPTFASLCSPIGCPRGFQTGLNPLLRQVWVMSHMVKTPKSPWLEPSKAANGWADSGCRLPCKTQVIGQSSATRSTNWDQICSKEEPQKKTNLFQTDCIFCFTLFCPGVSICSCPKLDNIPMSPTSCYYTYGWSLNQRGLSTVIDTSSALSTPPSVLL